MFFFEHKRNVLLNTHNMIGSRRLFRRCLRLSAYAILCLLVFSLWLIWATENFSHAPFTKDGRYKIHDYWRYVFHTRPGPGRAGNWFWEYVVVRLVAAHYQQAFVCFYRFPEPFNHVPHFVFRDPYVELNTSVLELEGNGDGPVLPSDFYYFPFLMGNREYIQTVFFPTVQVAVKTHDVTVHVRMGDMISYGVPGKVPMVPKFYVDVFTRLVHESKVNSNSNIIMIGNPENEWQYEIFNKTAVCICGVINCTIPIQMLDSAKESVSDAIYHMMQAPIFVGSTSSFWQIPTFVSRVVREVHTPIIGITQFMDIDSGDEYQIVRYHNLEWITSEQDWRDRWNVSFLK